MSDLQRVLRSTYFDCWKRRNKIADRLNELLGATNSVRDELNESQRWLELVASEWRASGYDRVDDYLNRVWLLPRPKEHPIDPDDDNVVAETET